MFKSFLILMAILIASLSVYSHAGVLEGCQEYEKVKSEINIRHLIYTKGGNIDLINYEKLIEQAHSLYPFCELVGNEPESEDTLITILYSNEEY